MLKLFHVDIESFAVAGAFVIFLMSLEMILDIEIFKNQGPIKEATLVPLVFPLLAGPGISTHGKLPYDAFQYLSLWKAVTIPSTQEKEKKN